MVSITCVSAPPTQLKILDSQLADEKGRAIRFY